MKSLLLLGLLSLLAPLPAKPTPVSVSRSGSYYVPLGGLDLDYVWGSWMHQHGKNYTTSHEYSTRRGVFMTNLHYVNAHNARFQNGEVSYELGMNQFGDLTQSEWANMYLGYNAKAVQPTLRCGKTSCSLKSLADVSNLTIGPNPASVDWREKGAVTPVKNQGQCGSCWSFSATGAMEGANFVSTGKLVSLSEQQLVDCSSAEGDHGCFGGLMDNAFRYVIQNGGIDTESDYPYYAKSGSCNAKKAAKHSVKLTGFSDVPQNSESALESAVVHQPVSVAIEADQSDFQFYKSGVFNGTCGTQLDHGVLVVGYGDDNGSPYWIVKNSWGEAWGNNGYIWLAKDIASPQGQCGVAMQPSYPTV